MDKYRLRRVGLGIAVVLLVGLVALAAVLVLRGIEKPEVWEAGLHDVRTGEAVDDAHQALRDGVQFVYVIYFHPDCSACEEYMPEVVEAWLYLISSQYGDKFGIALIDVGKKTDSELREWADEHDIPLDVPVLGGAHTEQNGLPDDLLYSSGADMNPGGVPATFLDYEYGGDWYSWGAAPGLISADYLVANAVQYFMWRESKGD